MEVPDETSKGSLGFINQGEFHRYNNWPPLGFQCLSKWLSFLGDSIFNARVFFVLVSSITTVLFYYLTEKYTTQKITAFLATCLFIFLPYRLTFSSLIYADMWVPLFWILFLLLASREINFWVLSLIGLSGFLLNWMAPLILPAHYVVHYIQKHNASIKVQIGVFVLLFICINLTIYFIYWHNGYPNESQHIVGKLFKYSILGMAVRIEPYGLGFVKRMIGVVLEFLPFLVLLGLMGKKFFFTSAQKEFIKILKTALWAILFLLMIFGNWVGMHTQSIIFFDVLVGLICFQYLSQFNTLHLQKAFPFSLLVGLLVFFLIPHLSADLATLEKTDDEIVDYINSKSFSLDKKLLFFDIKGAFPNAVCDVFSISTQCDAIQFEKTFNEQLDVFMGKKLERAARLKLNRDLNIDTVFLITESTPEISKSFHKADSLTLENVKTYQLIRFE